MEKTIRIKVNNTNYELSVQPNMTLAEFLRDELGLTGTKIGCDKGDCGTCTVLVDGEAVNSCLVPVVRVHGREVLTIEGLETEVGLHPLQKAFIKHGAIQCGFCTPGMLLSAKSLLDKNPRPSDEDIRVAISGNLCRCTGYQKIIEAVQAAVQRQLK